MCTVKFLLCTVVLSSSVSGKPTLKIDRSVAVIGASLTFTCTTSSQITAVVTFLKQPAFIQGACLAPSGGTSGTCRSNLGFSVSQSLSSKTTTLTISSVSQTVVSGVWYCRHAAGAGDDDDSNTLDITDFARQFSLSTSGSTVSGSSLTFICDTIETSVKAVVWYKNISTYTVSENRGACVKPANVPSDYSVTCSSSTHIFNLTISNVSFSRHNGTVWKCKYPFGISDSNPIDLVVTVPLTSATILNTSSSQIAVISGDDVTLVCRTNPCYPTASVAWFKNSANITQGVTNKIQTTTSGVTTTSSLTLSVRWSDNSHRVYCMATNGEMTETSQTVQLNAQVPVSSVTLQNITANNQYVETLVGSVTLTCETSSSLPASTVTWYKDNILVNSGVTSKTEADSTGLVKTICSTTQRVSRTDDETRWFCRAGNIQGQQIRQSNTAVLDVWCKPEVPTSCLCSSHTSTSIELKWTSATTQALEGIWIQFRESDKGSWNNATVLNVWLDGSSTVHANITNLQEGILYYFRIYLGRGTNKNDFCETSFPTLSIINYERCSSNENNLGKGIAIGVGVAVAVAALFAVVLWIMWSRGTLCFNQRKDKVPEDTTNVYSDIAMDKVIQEEPGQSTSKNVMEVSQYEPLQEGRHTESKPYESLKTYENISHGIPQGTVHDNTN